VFSLGFDPARRFRIVHQGKFYDSKPVVTGRTAPHGELLTVAEVAEMTRLSAGTLRYWRALGEGGPASFKLGRRVMYRRADVEKWLEEASG
jgi:excisionase family DNA binding protein